MARVFQPPTAGGQDLHGTTVLLVVDDNQEQGRALPPLPALHLLRAFLLAISLIFC